VSQPHASQVVSQPHVPRASRALPCHAAHLLHLLLRCLTCRGELLRKGSSEAGGTGLWVCMRLGGESSIITSHHACPPQKKHTRTWHLPCKHIDMAPALQRRTWYLPCKCIDMQREQEGGNTGGQGAGGWEGCMCQVYRGGDRKRRGGCSLPQALQRQRTCKMTSFAPCSSCCVLSCARQWHATTFVCANMCSTWHMS
jgi:hypothetical protein